MVHSCTRVCDVLPTAIGDVNFIFAHRIVNNPILITSKRSTKETGLIVLILYYSERSVAGFERSRITEAQQAAYMRQLQLEE